MVEFKGIRLWECMMRRKIAVICGAVLLAVVLLGGCSSVASGTVRTTAAVEVRSGDENG